MSDSANRNGATISFGPFLLYPTQRLLEKEGVPISMGGRALDILIQLAEHAGEIVDKRALIQKVWVGLVVDEGSLRFHVSELRKALGDGQDGARYVANVPGRGYSLVAPVSRQMMPESVSAKTVLRAYSESLPARPVSMIGRDIVIRDVVQDLLVRRFVMLVGPGGIGKTTIAVAAAHALLDDFKGAVQFFDFGPLNDARLVPSTVATTLGLTPDSEKPISGLVSHLRDKRMLLVFDCCEHVVNHLAELAEGLFKECPQVWMLATSREALQVEGEWLYQVSPLEFPPPDLIPNASKVVSYPAAQLFVERAKAGIWNFELSEADATSVADICRKLDGIPLAIELAAGRVHALGIQGVSKYLAQGLELLWQGKRTAPPRHRTLGAMLDWSNNLLPPVEAIILRRLSVLAGSFTIKVAQAVSSGDGVEASQIVESIASLVAKSLIATDSNTSSPRYRLLDTTRDYFANKLSESGEANKIALKHARFFRTLINHSPADRATDICSPDTFGDNLGNVRVALGWCFSDQGDAPTGIALAAESARFFIEMSLLSECRQWVSRAVAACEGTSIDPFHEIELQTALGFSLMFTQGNSEVVRVAFEKAIELAEATNHQNLQLRPLSGYFLYLSYTGHYRDSLRIAEKCKTLGAEKRNLAAEKMGEWMMGVALHTLGDQLGARRCCDSATKRGSTQHLDDTLAKSVGHDYRLSALIILARVLWLLGSPDKAVTVARYFIKEAEPLELPIVLLGTLPVSSIFIWTGDWTSAEEVIGRVATLAEKNSFAAIKERASWYRGVLEIKRGRPQSGIEIIRGTIEAASKRGQTFVSTPLFSALAEGLAMTGQLDEALAAIDHALALVKDLEGWFETPEIVRIKADILRQLNPADPSLAEEYLLQSLEHSRKQSTLGWELRSATSLARLWSENHRFTEARDLLASVYERFEEGIDNLDLVAARRLLEELALAPSGARP